MAHLFTGSLEACRAYAKRQATLEAQLSYPITIQENMGNDPTFYTATKFAVIWWGFGRLLVIALKAA